MELRYSDYRDILPEAAAPHPGERLLQRFGACVDHPTAEPHWWTISEQDDSPDIPALVRVGKKRPFNHRTTRSRAWHAKRICNEECPVRALCQEVSDHLEAQFMSATVPEAYFAGVRGGEGPNQRVTRRRSQHAEAA